MDEPFPINRIAHLFGAKAIDPALEDLLLKFTDTAVVFLDDPFDPSSNNEATSLSKPIDRLLWLMVREAADEGATQIRIELRSDGVAVLYWHAGGQVQERDKPPRRLFRPLFTCIKLRCGERQEFVVHDQIIVAVCFDQTDPCEGLTLTIRREPCRPSGA